MLRLLVFAIVIGVVSCGGDEEPGLDGTWATEITGTSCVASTSFEGSDIVQQRMCPLTDGRTGMELTLMVFARTPERLTIAATHSTCPGPRFTDDVGYLLERDTLTLVFTEGVVVLKRVPKMTSPTGGAFSFGCFDGPDRFTENPVVPLN